ncbi:MAG: twin-arginine translocase TatA/TatE family subunit [Deltaproteobacteria bacterium]|nr:twin-arginine translocase TatA/TatE family subunit [Candidatus Zymogenaceae bacterium]
MFGLGTTELLVILVIALVIFGGSKLPELGSALGKGIKNFKKGLSSIGEDDEKKEINNSGGQSGKKIEP